MIGPGPRPCAIGQSPYLRYMTAMNSVAMPAAKGKIFAIAPMMDWTDRHCRAFHRG